MPNPIPPLPSSPQSKTDDAMSSAETSSIPTPRPDPTEANPWRMLVIGTVSLLTAIAVTPVVACFLVPLLTTVEFMEGVQIDAGGVFVFVSTLFVAFYKFAHELWSWLQRQGWPAWAGILAMVAAAIALNSFNYLGLCGNPA